ncbi:SsgA family sporulation/cell division regulator [Streptacidiphilus rugosus]|uniref:SsgA family sporulation/cell division regulator n=1 Tax=Streptacidiphilus rugosus TaxID=405783 RepID=UPI0006894432|nr:SsgA family sporulation/cell division regulator [Streptacidiphilus rugosus]
MNPPHASQPPQAPEPPRPPRPPVDRATAAACGADIRLHLVAGHMGEIPVSAQLTYTQADPYAVRLHCLTGPSTTVTWVLDRASLRSGLRRVSGLGDVVISPGPGSGSLSITLGSGPGAALLRAEAEEIRGFLRLTEHVVPYGAEGRHLDIDDLIARLRGAP